MSLCTMYANEWAHMHVLSQFLSMIQASSGIQSTKVKSAAVAEGACLYVCMCVYIWCICMLAYRWLCCSCSQSVHEHWSAAATHGRLRWGRSRCLQHGGHGHEQVYIYLQARASAQYNVRTLWHVPRAVQTCEKPYTWKPYTYLQYIYIYIYICIAVQTCPGTINIHA
jgi:hypothetical protein